jgi:hypothetical protein
MVEKPSPSQSFVTQGSASANWTCRFPKHYCLGFHFHKFNLPGKFRWDRWKKKNRVYGPVSEDPSWPRKGGEAAVSREMQEHPLFGLEEQGDEEKQATEMPPNREGPQGRVVVQVEFARINSLPLITRRRRSNSFNRAEFLHKKGGGATVLTIPRQKPSPEPDYASEHDRKLLEGQKRASHLGRTDLCHVQGGEHTIYICMSSKCHRRPVKRFGPYVERTG